jgi:hypothetical protein
MSTRKKRGGLNAAVAAVLEGERAAADLNYPTLGQRCGLSARTLMRKLSTHEADLDINEVAAIGEVFHLAPSEVVARGEEYQLRNSPEDVGREIARLINDRRDAEARRTRGDAG